MRGAAVTTGRILIALVFLAGTAGAGEIGGSSPWWHPASRSGEGGPRVVVEPPSIEGEMPAGSLRVARLVRASGRVGPFLVALRELGVLRPRRGTTVAANVPPAGDAAPISGENQ